MKSQINKKNGSFWMGSTLILLGIIDAFADPLAFIDSPALIGSGISMIGISINSSNTKNDKNIPNKVKKVTEEKIFIPARIVFASLILSGIILVATIFSITVN